MQGKGISKIPVAICHDIVPFTNHRKSIVFYPSGKQIVAYLLFMTSQPSER